MKIYLHPNGWPTTIDKAPCGLLMRMRKGRTDLFFKADSNAATETNIQIFNMEGKQTFVTGNVTPVRLMKEAE